MAPIKRSSVPKVVPVHRLAPANSRVKQAKTLGRRPLHKGGGA